MDVEIPSIYCLTTRFLQWTFTISVTLFLPILSTVEWYSGVKVELTEEKYVSMSLQGWFNVENWSWL